MAAAIFRFDPEFRETRAELHHAVRMGYKSSPRSQQTLAADSRWRTDGQLAACHVTCVTDESKNCLAIYPLLLLGCLVFWAER